MTYAEKIGAGDRLLDPARPAVELERVVRALHPHIGARAQLPTARCSGCSGPRWPGPPAVGPTAPTPRLRRGPSARSARARRAPAARLPPGALELLRGAAAGRARDGRRRLSARSRAARARVAARVRRRRDARAQARVGLGLARLCGERDDARPRRQRVVLLVVQRRSACATFADACSIGIARTAVAFSSFSVGGRTSRQRPGTMCSTIASHRRDASRRGPPRSCIAPISITER